MDPVPVLTTILWLRGTFELQYPIRIKERILGLGFWRRF